MLGVYPAQEILLLYTLPSQTFLSCARAREFKIPPLSSPPRTIVCFLACSIAINGPSHFNCIAIRLPIFFSQASGTNSLEGKYIKLWWIVVCALWHCIDSSPASVFKLDQTFPNLSRRSAGRNQEAPWPSFFFSFVKLIVKSISVALDKHPGGIKVAFGLSSLGQPTFQ
jgi:hypothetical protein